MASTLRETAGQNAQFKIISKLAQLRHDEEKNSANAAGGKAEEAQRGRKRRQEVITGSRA
jgi:hypothetical protein